MFYDHHIILISYRFKNWWSLSTCMLWCLYKISQVWLKNGPHLLSRLKNRIGASSMDRETRKITLRCYEHILKFTHELYSYTTWINLRRRFKKKKTEENSVELNVYNFFVWDSWFILTVKLVRSMLSRNQP